MPYAIKANISGATKALNKVSANVRKKALPNAIARISLKSARYIKCEAPVKTGTLRRGLNAHPTLKPTSIVHGTSYTYAANVRSRRPGFIQKTLGYVTKISQKEAEMAIDNVLKAI
jgi:hypothetical protein